LPTPHFNTMVCRHCDKAKCVNACPKEALVPDESKSKSPVEAKCDWLRKCVEACHFMRSGRSYPEDCDQCDLCAETPGVGFCSFGAIRSPFELRMKLTFK